MARFFRRAFLIAVILYFAIAAYGRYMQAAETQREQEQVCPCDQCDCGPPIEEPKHVRQ